MYYLRRLSISAVALVALIFLIWLLPRLLNPTPPNKEQREENRQWVDTSPYWLDRQACRWLSMCGVLHIRSDPAARPEDEDDDDDDRGDLRRLELRSWDQRPEYNAKWQNTMSNDPPTVAGHTGNLKEIPDYVLKYAPLVHLYSGESFWPSDIADHVRHMSPFANDTQLNNTAPISLNSLHGLDTEPGFVFLKSNDDVESRPKWLHSRDNIPTPFADDDEDLEHTSPERSGEEPYLGESTSWTQVDRAHPLRRISDPRKRPHRPSRAGQSSARRRPRSSPGDDDFVPPTPHHKPDDEGYSKAPATLVLVDKGSGIVDAFWFFFYAYNLGQTVLGIRFGNHVGDWEHCMVRFEHGIPRGVYFSEHEGGQAYAFHAVEKRSNPDTQVERPVIYSALGSHAMYAAPGNHPYVLPFGMLKDETDKGPLWDPAKNIRSYWYDYEATGDADGLEPTKENPGEPTDWFHYEGPWGDKLYGLDDARQWRLFGQYHYVTGPLGPKFKNLEREKMCILWNCRILQSLEEGAKGSWHS